MTETAIIHDPIRDDAIYTPDEIGLLVKCSASYVREEIKRGRLRAFRLGERFLRIKGVDAQQWINNFEDTGSASSGENGAPSGMSRSAGDTALVSVLKGPRPKR